MERSSISDSEGDQVVRRSSNSVRRHSSVRTRGEVVEEKATPMEDARIQELDPETEFLCSKRKTQNDWELFKENVRPLKRGRNISILNNALKSHTDNHIKKSLLENRRFSPLSLLNFHGTRSLFFICFAIFFQEID